MYKYCRVDVYTLEQNGKSEIYTLFLNSIIQKKGKKAHDLFQPILVVFSKLTEMPLTVILRFRFPQSTQPVSKLALEHLQAFITRRKLCSDSQNESAAGFSPQVSWGSSDVRWPRGEGARRRRTVSLWRALTGEEKFAKAGHSGRGKRPLDLWGLKLPITFEDSVFFFFFPEALRGRVVGEERLPRETNLHECLMAFLLRWR